MGRRERRDGRVSNTHAQLIVNFISGETGNLRCKKMVQMQIEYNSENLTVIALRFTFFCV